MYILYRLLDLKSINFITFITIDLNKVKRPKIFIIIIMVKDVIKDIMVDNNMNQQQLADILQVNQTTVGQWILGKKKPSFESIYQIYVKFGVTPNELFEIE